MKNRLSLKILVFALLAIIIMSTAVCANAVQTEKAVDTNRKCSLRLTYHSQNKYFEGLRIQIFHIADVSLKTQYTLTPQFQSYPVDINGISSQTEWDEAAFTLTSYITAESVSPAAEKVTDKNGVVRFTDLKTGLYLVRWTKNQTKDNVSGFEPFIISVPGLDDKGDWIYDIDSYPKPGKNTPTDKETEYRAVILWSDRGYEDQRPDSVQIEIFRNGKSMGVYTLSSKDNWTYRWKAKDDGSEWTVVELDAGRKYNVTISEFGNVFTIVNHYSGEEQSSDDKEQSKEPYDGDISRPVIDPDEKTTPEPLKTGDSAETALYVLTIAALSGMLLFILFASGRRKRYDK